MKDKFNWYFSPSKDEIDAIWDTGILTVDANVLLDLYRYHESTRNSLISNLKNFNGRLWLSSQAAEEFFRNRSKVIASSEKTFKQANEDIDKLKGSLESTITQLKGNRIIPANVAESLQDKIHPVIEEAQNSINSAKTDYPQYLQTDPILDDLSEMFKNAIGDCFSKDDMKSIIEEAEQRINDKIPPGYLDQDKDGERSYGDFILWRQILLHSKNKSIPIIFVTSERKDDWWEKLSGKTIGPRPELLREANKFCGQRILIYQTDRFLEYASDKSGTDIDESIVQEIRDVDTLRSEREHPVELIEQASEENSEILHEGFIVLDLKRPVKNITGSGRFSPRMKSVPNVKSELVERPEDTPSVKVRAGAGNNYAFNLHVISVDRGAMLPPGQYKLKYTATCNEIEDAEELESEI